MNIAIKHSGGTQTVPIDALLLQRRIVQIAGKIDDAAAMDFVQQVMCLSHEDPTAPIKVLINSGGGEVGAGMLIYDVMQGSKAPMEMICFGKAYSMAAILFASGRKGSRYILPHSSVMIHEPLIPYGVGGKSSSVQTISESLLKTKRDMDELLAKHTGKTPEEIAENTMTDHYFTASEAVEFGMADKIIEFSEIFG